MKKKIVGAVIAAMMALSLSVTSLAAEIASGGDIPAETEAVSNAEAVDAAGQKVDVTINDAATIEDDSKLSEVLDKDVADKLEEAKKGVQSGISKDVLEELKVDSIKDIQYVAVADIEVPAGAGDVTITVDVAGIKAGDKVLVVHLKSNADGTLSIEYLPAAEVTTDGKVTFTVTSGSPFAFAKVEGETSTGAETPATETPATEAPSTETPASETPVTETPATEAAETETPGDTETEITEEDLQEEGDDAQDSSEKDSTGTASETEEKDSSAVTSPKTGNTNYAVWVILSGLVTAVLVLSGRKKENV